MIPLEVVVPGSGCSVVFDCKEALAELPICLIQDAPVKEPEAFVAERNPQANKYKNTLVRSHPIYPEKLSGFGTCIT